MGSWALGRDTGACWCPLGPEVGILKKMSLFELYSHLTRALQTSSVFPVISIIPGILATFGHFFLTQLSNL